MELLPNRNDENISTSMMVIHLSCLCTVLLLCSMFFTSYGRAMTNLERQMEASKKFEASKRKNVDLRANSKAARQTLDEELARAKQMHKDRRSGLEAKRAEASLEWARKKREEDETKARAIAAAKRAEMSAQKPAEKSSESSYEYVYVDEEGNYYEGAEEEDEEEEVDEDEEYGEDEEGEEREVGSARLVPGIPLAQGYARTFLDDPSFSFRRIKMPDFLSEMHNKSSCAFRNVTHSGRLRDDHQLNLREQRESLKERRREKRDRKNQEVLDEVLEHEGRRVTLSRMSSQELLDQKEYQKNLSRAEKVMASREGDGGESTAGRLELVQGSRVMARYDKKPQFILGRITRAHPDGSFDIRYDMGVEETRVDRALMVPVAQEEVEAAGAGKKPPPLVSSTTPAEKISGVFDELKERGMSSKEQQKQHFLELYAKREEMRQEEEQEEQEEKPESRLMGADCESQACGACKLVVDEYAQRVHRHINNKEVQTLDALLDYTTPLCDSPQIVNKYSKAVQMVCQSMFAQERHREFFIRTFEADSDWDNVLSATTLLPKKQQICQSSGFCSEDAFEYERDEDDGWGSDECFVCHAVMEDMEEKATLYKTISEKNSPGIVKTGCSNLVFEDESFHSACAEMIAGISLIEVAWTVKLHYEQIQKRRESFRSFPDTACEKLGLCERWVDPDREGLTSVLDEIEHVYS